MLLSSPFPVKTVPGESNLLKNIPDEANFVVITDPANGQGRVELGGSFVKGDRLEATGSFIARQSRMNFKDQMIIHDRGSVFVGESLQLSTGSLKFEINKDTVKGGDQQNGLTSVEYLTNMDPFHLDPRMAGAPNFAYLPPINKVPPGVELHRVWPFILLGSTLKDLGDNEAAARAEGAPPPESIDNIKSMIQAIPEFGSSQNVAPAGTTDPENSDTNSMEKREIFFGGISEKPLHLQFDISQLTLVDYENAKRCLMYVGPRSPTGDQTTNPLANFSVYSEEHLNDSLGHNVRLVKSSKNSNLLIQIFELSNSGAPPSSGLKKLSVVDYGLFQDEDPTTPGKRVFFIGKTYFDKSGTRELKFANIFTVVFE
jgi:hypothetical protein